MANAIGISKAEGCSKKRRRKRRYILTLKWRRARAFCVGSRKFSSAAFSRHSGVLTRYKRLVRMLLRGIASATDFPFSLLSSLQVPSRPSPSKLAALLYARPRYEYDDLQRVIIRDLTFAQSTTSFFFFFSLQVYIRKCEFHCTI